MKYDKMVECSLERSKQKVETAKREIQEMLESKKKITVAALIQKNRLFLKRIFFIENEVKNGRQAYVICPMVEESEMIEAENVLDYTKILRKNLPASVWNIFTAK